jgi:hypothetical protein
MPIGGSRLNQTGEKPGAAILGHLADRAVGSGKHKLEGGQPLLPINNEMRYDSARLRRLFLHDDRTQEVAPRRHLRLACEQDLEVFPEGSPMAVLLPNVWALIERNLVANVAHKQLVDRQDVRLHRRTVPI